MLLNEFLGFRLGLSFEKKYNFLVIKEVLENKDKYPIIYPYISEGVDYDDNDKVIKKAYDFGFFDCDDIDCAGADEALELNRAFNRVVLRDLVNKKLKVKSFSFGVDYLMNPSITGVQDPYLNYRAITYITITPSEKTIGMEIFNHNIVDGQRYGHLSSEYSGTTYYEDNRKVLEKVENEFIQNRIEDFVVQRFETNDLVNLETEIKGVKCYIHDVYCFRIGDNYLKFYTTERGFDPLGVFRMIAEQSLTDEQKKNDIPKQMGLYVG